MTRWNRIEQLEARRAAGRTCLPATRVKEIMTEVLGAGLAEAIFGDPAGLLRRLEADALSHEERTGLAVMQRWRVSAEGLLRQWCGHNR